MTEHYTRNTVSVTKTPIQLALEAGLEVKVREGLVVVRCTEETAKYLASEHVQIAVGPFCLSLIHI